MYKITITTAILHQQLCGLLLFYMIVLVSFVFDLVLLANSRSLLLVAHQPSSSHHLIPPFTTNNKYKQKQTNKYLLSSSLLRCLLAESYFFLVVVIHKLASYTCLLATLALQAITNKRRSTQLKKQPQRSLFHNCYDVFGVVVGKL